MEMIRACIQTFIVAGITKSYQVQRKEMVILAWTTVFLQASCGRNATSVWAPNSSSTDQTGADLIGLSITYKPIKALL